MWCTLITGEAAVEILTWSLLKKGWTQEGSSEFGFRFFRKTVMVFGKDHHVVLRIAKLYNLTLERSALVAVLVLHFSPEPYLLSLMSFPTSTIRRFLSHSFTRVHSLKCHPSPRPIPPRGPRRERVSLAWVPVGEWGGRTPPQPSNPK